MKSQTSMFEGIQHLPNDVSAFPLHYNTEDLQLMNGSQLHKSTVALKHQLKKVYKIINKLPNFPHFVTFNKFLATYTAVQSRTFGSSTFEGQFAPLVPSGDFIYPDAIQNAEWIFTDEGYGLITTKPLE